MPRSRPAQDDIFSRAEILRRRHALSGRELREAADAATGDDLLQVLVAASMVIAHADGGLDLAERRKLIEAFTTNAALEGFSVSDLAAELAGHLRAYEHDPISAEAAVLAVLGAASLSPAEKAFIGTTCAGVIVADGLVHPAELGALNRVQIALGLTDEVVS